MTPISPTRAYVLDLLLLTVGVLLVVVATGLPWLTLAVVLGIVATRGWGRTLAAGLLALGGLLAVVNAVAALAGEAVAPGATGVVGGLAVTVAAVWAMARGRRWPAMGGRYERARKQPGASSRLAAWDALDHGVDPTEDGLDGESG